MSVEQFTEALKMAVIKNNPSWNESVLVKSINKSGIRQAYQNNPEVNDFTITLNTAEEIVRYMRTGNSSRTNVYNKARRITPAQKAQAAAAIERMKKLVETKGGTIEEDESGTLIFRNVNFFTINELLQEGFSRDNITGSKRRLGSGFHRGHVFSIATNNLKENVINDLKKQLNRQDIDQADRDALEKVISVVEAYVSEMEKNDINSANKDLKLELVADYQKNPGKFLIEMQLMLDNILSGQQVGALLSDLRSITNPELIEQTIGSILNKASTPDFVKSMLSSEGSPSLKTLIVNSILNALDPSKNRDTKAYKSAKTVIGSLNISTGGEVNKLIKQQKQKLKKVLSELKSAKQNLSKKRTANISTVNLVQLQNLLNAGIVEQVKRNMGTGNRRDVLNLRTGRFAESVKVERMSESRQGMITAFYSYMKNPYATFSTGGQQESPKTRDPKLLIAKSIREIAAQQVANRLRSVSV